MNKEYINKKDFISSIFETDLPWSSIWVVLGLISNFPVKIIEDSIPTDEEIEDMERKDKK